MSTLPKFPAPIRLRGRLFFKRSELEHHKNELTSAACGSPAPDYVKPEIEVLVPANEVAREFGQSRRTIGRRIAELANEVA